MLGRCSNALRLISTKPALSQVRPNTIYTARRIPSIVPAASFSTFGALRHGKEGVSRGDGPYTVHFITPEGEKIDVKATEGDSMLDLAQRYDIDLECACEGSLACSTCHVICEEDYYNKMEEPTDEENDMLDLAFGLTDTSRLGCQVFMNKDLDGLTVKMPSATRNMRVDGSKPTHH